VGFFFYGKKRRLDVISPLLAYTLLFLISHNVVTIRIPPDNIHAVGIDAYSAKKPLNNKPAIPPI